MIYFSIWKFIPCLHTIHDIPHEVLIARNLRKYVSSKETPEYTFWGILYICVDLQK